MRMATTKERIQRMTLTEDDQEAYKNDPIYVVIDTRYDANGRIIWIDDGANPMLANYMEHNWTTLIAATDYEPQNPIIEEDGIDDPRYWAIHNDVWQHFYCGSGRERERFHSRVREAAINAGVLEFLKDREAEIAAGNIGYRLY